MNSNTPKYILIHCSDDSYRNCSDQLQKIDSYHRERGFPKSSLNYWVGYHYLITDDKEYKCRADTDEGAHCNQHQDGISMNFQSIGVCWGGDGDIEYPTPIQYGLLQKRVWALQDKYNIPDERVKFHRDYATSKTCPGSLLDKQWLATLLIRPVDVVIPSKPIEHTCVAQEAEITQLKQSLRWYDYLLSWMFGNRKY